ncbi:MAG: T9SS type A sorting domain-containing protein, partial [bacterium]|nr:T9SS type A sorting domain-containing protein [Candidatus Limimorpha caballi]
MKRKFTFLLMALLTLAGLQGWAQRGYTYEKLTGAPDPTAEYVLGYQDNSGNYYFHSSGETVNNMTLSAPSADTKIYQLSGHSLNFDYVAAKCNNKYLAVSGGVYFASSQDYYTALEIDNGIIQGVVDSYARIYHAGNIIKSGGNSDYLYFYKRTGSSAPTYAVTVTSDTEGCTASADKASYEEGETVTLSYEADAFHYFVEWQSSDVTITGNTFEMPANDVSVNAHFAAKPTHSITATVNPESAGTASVTYQSNTITEAPAGAVLNLSAIANPGFDFVSWTIGGEVVSTSANYDYTMPDNDVAIVANFDEHQLLHVNIDPNIVGGTITVNPSECDPGATVTVTPNASSGYQYVYGNITVTDANGQPVYVYQSYPSSTFTMPSTDVTVSATFSKSYYISIGTQQHCTVSTSPMGSATAGATVSVLITPEAGYRVTNVTATYAGGEITAVYSGEWNNQFMYDFTMPAADVTVNVVCALTYTVNYTQPAGGTINVSPATYVPAGQEVSIDITNIYDHYSFDYDNYESKISVKDANENPVTVNQEDNTHYNFEMPASNVTVSVTFDQDANYDIAVTQPEGCTIEVYPSENVYAGETVYLSYYGVQTGYEFVEWVVKDGEETITPEYDYYYGYFTMPASENVTVTANVQALTAHTVSIAEGITGGSISAHTDYDYETPINAYAGEFVYLTNTPDPGYQFVSFTVTSECGTVEVYNNFYFHMPDCDVTVSATFIKPETLTVFENGGQYDYNSVYPIYTYWGDAVGTTSQFIIPAEELENMAGGTIKGMKFFIYSGGQTGNQIWECRIKEVDYKALNGIVDVSTLTPVYSGHYLAFEDNKWNLTFDTPFAYSGKNLLVSFQCTTKGTYKSNSFWGETYNFGDEEPYNTSYSSRAGGSTFIPKTEFTYLPDPTAVFYNIEIAQVEGGTITASKTKAKADAEIELSVNMDEGYTFSRWIVKDADSQDVTVTNNFFTMPASNVTVTAEYNTLPRYNVTLVPSVGGSITATPSENILKGTWVKLVATPDHGYRFVSWSGSTEAGETLYIATVATSGFTMRASNATVTATFEALPTYEVNYYANGTLVNTLNPYENDDVDITPCEVPEGVEFYGWAISEINEDPYLTTAPSIITAGTPVNADMNLYAVFKYAEEISLAKGGDTWMKITSPSELIDGQEIVLVYNNSYVMGERQGQYSMNYYRYAVSVADDKISSLPSSATIFTLEQSSGNWKLHYNDFGTPTTLSYNTNDGLTNYGMWLEYGCYTYDEWTAEGTSNVIFRNNYSYEYIGEDESEYSSIIHSVANASLACQAFKKGATINTYYMTSVLTDGEVAENTTAKNIIITTGTVTVDNDIVLTMNENGLFRNKDAANFVFGYGAQLITDNTGVIATFKKHITGNDWYTISSPLAAGNTAFADVTNLIPNNNIAAKTYDLYRFDEASGMWINARPVEGQTSNLTTIDKGVGYIYANNAGADHIAFAGEVNVAPAECTLTNGAAHGFNLIGNPFMQNIKLTDVKSDGTAVLADGFYVLNNDETWATEPITTGTIAPLQGFLVQATTAGTATISKPTAAPSKGERSEEHVTNIEVIVSNSNYRDNAYAMFGEGTGLNKVNHRNAQAPMLYVPQDGEDFAIAFMNENTTVFPLSFKAMTTGSYSISLKPTDDVSTLVLVDNMTGEETNMLLEDSYTFIGSPADNENRFTVKLKISNSQDEDEHFAYQNGSELVINGEGTLQIFDVLGRVVVSEEVHGQTVNVGGLNTGAYIVRLTGESVKTQK